MSKSTIRWAWEWLVAFECLALAALFTPPCMVLSILGKPELSRWVSDLLVGMWPWPEDLDPAAGE